MAASYFSIFVAGLFVSFIEFLGWCAYMGGYTAWIRVWIEFTFYSFIWWIPAWLFALVEMAAPTTSGGLAMASPWPVYMANSVFLLIMGLIMWIYISVIHIIYTQPLKDHIDTLNSVCYCDISLPVVPEQGEKAREYQEVLAKAECLKKCPPSDVLDARELAKKAKKMTASEIEDAGSEATASADGGW